MLDQLITFSIIGQRYLGTEHEADEIENFERELVNRGMTGRLDRPTNTWRLPVSGGTSLAGVS